MGLGLRGPSVDRWTVVSRRETSQELPGLMLLSKPSSAHPATQQVLIYTCWRINVFDRRMWPTWPQEPPNNKTPRLSFCQCSFFFSEQTNKKQNKTKIKSGKAWVLKDTEQIHLSSHRKKNQYLSRRLSLRHWLGNPEILLAGGSPESRGWALRLQHPQRPSQCEIISSLERGAGISVPSKPSASWLM